MYMLVGFPVGTERTVNTLKSIATDMRQGSDIWPSWMKNVAGPSKLLPNSPPWRVKQEARSS
jgi:hypothetical protein